MSTRLRYGIICCCLMLLLGACGNKGPVQLPDEEPKEAKTQGS